MWGHRLGKSLAVCASMLFIQSCTQSLDGGSIEKTFTGITQALVMGPETVDITWATNSNCNTYEIYLLSSSASASIGSAALSPYRVKAPKIIDQQAYTFAVGCASSSGVTGQDVVLDATTWSKFSGVMTSSIDTTGQNPILVLNWAYQSSTGTVFQVFAKESIVPGDLTSPVPWQLTRPGAAGTAYTETPVCTTYEQSVRIGVGGNCVPNLKPGVTYNFKVVAKYPDGSYSNDIAGNGTTQTVPAAFTPPACVLTQSGIGAESTSSYLFLRCGAATGGSCPIVSVKAYQVNGSSRTVISDSITAPGTLKIQPTIHPSATNSRTVEGLEIDYTCLSTNPTSVSTTRYNNSDAQHQEPAMKYGNDGYESAPIQSYEEGQHPSNLGLVTAIGDFNCNGKPDLAMGLPNVTFNSPPYYNKNSSSGAVKVIYDYVQNANGTYSGASEQYLSFRDLPANAGFGRTLSAGNINKDVYADFNTASYYSCDDLIVGAPGLNASTTFGSASNASNFTGAAYVFYGQPQKFAQPFDSSGLAVNSSTCTGTITNQVCSVVRLAPDTTRWLKSHPNYTSESTNNNRSTGLPYNALGGYSYSAFGFQVSYIRDYNADGYGDIAVSDPYCDWDGEINNGHPSLLTGLRETIRQVGCVYVYWGGPSGITNVRMGTTPDGLNDLISPLAKIYPPIPEEGMHFGWSVSGGGDVDSRPPVPVKRNGGTNIILAQGNDFIVGAPDFVYTPTFINGGIQYEDTREGINATTAWTVNEGSSKVGCTSTCSVDPLVNQGPIPFNDGTLNFPSPKLVTPWNGAWTQDPSAWAGVKGPVYPNLTTQPGLRASTGIAFLYLGRSPISGYGIAVDDGFSKFPNLVNTTLPSIGQDSVEWLLSASTRDRSNGSQYLKVSNPPPAGSYWLVDPVTSFYNCGSRGSPTGASGGYYKHVSCLSGRNNFSIIYPALKTADAAVTRFGSKVQIAGSKDQNAIALYELGSAVGNTSGFASAYTRSGSDLFPLAQGSLHDQIRGTNLWNVGVQGVSAPIGAGAGFETFISHLGPNVCSTGNCSGYMGFLSRAPITETYGFPTVFSVTNPAKPTTDINQDGYADVMVSSDNGKLFTYYGNYAADFAYQGNNNSTAPNCSVTRITAIQGACGAGNTDFGTSLPGCTAFAGSGNNTGILPFTTYRGYSSAISGTTSTIVSQYPEVYLPSPGFYSRLGLLDDVGDTSTGTSIVYSYPTVPVNGSGVRNGAKSVAALSCLPFVKSYSGPITALSSRDMNNDGISDVILGLSGDSGNIGKTIISTAGTNGIGLSFDTAYTVNSANAKNGSSVSASNWMFMDGSSRRDLFSGASGYNAGSGAIYNYSGANMATLSTAANATIYEDSNFPNYLRTERSKIMGDINGDGFDDILVPVRRVSPTGSIYFNALIYFGSPFGPVTYKFCTSRIASISNASGGAISNSDCLGSAGSALASISGTQIRLPQYLSQPTGVSANWVLSAYQAGDVDHDGNADMLIMDYSAGAMYLYFGSSSGIVNGTPQVGAMVNHTPQLVLSNSVFMNNYGTVSGSLQPLTSFYPRNDYQVSRSNTYQSTQNYPLTNGDFNGDGFQDLAYTILTGVPGNENNWDCTPTQILDPLVGMCFGGASNSSIGGSDGAVFVIYGSITGYQTPVNGSQVPVPFDSAITMNDCPNFYNFNGVSGCKYTVNNSYNLSHIREVYNTLTVDVNGVWDVNTNRTACNPSTQKCKAELIRNPVYYNVSAFGGNSGFWTQMVPSYGFGSMLTVADTNNDGIDDLVVSHPNYYLPGFNTTDMPGNSIFASKALPADTSDQPIQGRAFIYYGVKDAGLVAPDASMVVGDKGLGLDTAPAFASFSQSAPSFPPFAIYPLTARRTSLSSTYWPELEQVGSPTTAYRQFGINSSSGDYNGDGIDDLAIVSNYGQLYVYYGPICQYDNTQASMAAMYNPANHSKGTLIPTGNIGPTQCSSFNFNVPLIANSTTNTITVSDVPSKQMYPQMIYAAGTSATSLFGAAIMSKRPVRAPASTVAIAWPGNIDNDPEKTSDLVIGSAGMQDPNVTSPSGTITGLGYVFFGHKDYATGEMPTTPGLYIGNASYNSALLTRNVPGSRCTTNCFYHQALILKAHTSDGLVGQFFLYESSLGDLNGDGTGDLVLPTADYHFGSDGSPVVTGGAFKLFY